MTSKRAILIGLLPAGMIFGHFFYPGLAVGFALSKFCSGKRDGDCGRVGSIVVSWRSFQLHLHHWFLSLLTGAVSAGVGFSLLSPALYYGFIGGLVFQGIYCYSDWHRIIRRKKSPPDLDDLSALDCEPQDALIV